MVLVLVPFNYLKMYSRAVKTFLSSRLIMNSWQLWNLAPKAQVLEGQGIQGHFFQSLGNVLGIPQHHRFEHFTDLILFKYASKLGNRCFTILFDGSYLLLDPMVEGHKSSRLMVANQLADLAGYQPLSIALFMNE